MRWYYVHIKGVYVGKLQACENDIRSCLGPYIRIEANGNVEVFARPCLGD